MRGGHEHCCRAGRAFALLLRGGWRCGLGGGRGSGRRRDAEQFRHVGVASLPRDRLRILVVSIAHCDERGATALHKARGTRQLAVGGGRMQRGGAGVVEQRDVRAFAQQPIEHSHMAARRRPVQRRVADPAAALVEERLVVPQRERHACQVSTLRRLEPRLVVQRILLRLAARRVRLLHLPRRTRAVLRRAAAGCARLLLRLLRLLLPLHLLLALALCRISHVGPAARSFAPRRASVVSCLHHLLLTLRVEVRLEQP
mmetsp:Transcript_6524/g.16409  ORF Transcript_6524/g.16409 Transcript_6524/m.16409 type:complete len:257 (+) Transcript_6524:827-1597(+)